MTLASVSKGVLAQYRELSTPINIAVFRALNLGDMLCTLPALRALRQGLPQAHIALIGLESALPVVARFPQYIDELIRFPGHPAFPERAVDHAAVPEFYRSMRARHFDLVLQMHGSGQHSNQIVQDMAPRQWAGFVPASDEAEDGRLFPWPDDLHEVHRYMALLRHLGAEADDDGLQFPVHPRERSEAARLAAQYGLEYERTIFVHAGARLASRRWPIARFAAVVTGLLQDGWQIALTGAASERDMAEQIRSMAGGEGRAVNLCGMTELGVLAALFQAGRLLICNDTGVSHVAAALGARSVVIASGSDVRRWAPLDATRHTVLHVDTACRPCAYDLCPIDHICALGVEVEHVLEQARQHLTQGGRP